MLNTVYVNFENVHDIKEKIEYSVEMSPKRFSIFKNDPKVGRNINATSKFQNHHRVTPMSKYVKPYQDISRSWAKGFGSDPGAQINAMSGLSSNVSANFSNSGFIVTLL